MSYRQYLLPVTTWAYYLGTSTLVTFFVETGLSNWMDTALATLLVQVLLHLLHTRQYEYATTDTLGRVVILGISTLHHECQ
ncbi:hypothetical protein B0I72DRAFT_33334 [Yarrowia lipolytica]|uniref:Uncharacterized protein n=1 Tax=Yarrowia lipolytica TaxID=4952 RepID=A0A371C7A8_YARLL|nr:hypothetical protein B0I71DRAFT_33650 [Yarrowia lipolytica]RDW32936.1 hypothetical protein B0I72DRAFT_33334 [Yarrowia lipolytica]RDW41863.1 hypothetical protein B0I73DRAFT_44861 [Yarrowia lipolytica]RDW45170.1 hypothetical protein B0I74DRAFT_39276 [Yarrowia lipolytica]RDW51858.1 hypothetical protein B0I75DRAFT_38540 [Yarrowia lipolytica]